MVVWYCPLVRITAGDFVLWGAMIQIIGVPGNVSWPHVAAASISTGISSAQRKLQMGHPGLSQSENDNARPWRSAEKGCEICSILCEGTLSKYACSSIDGSKICCFVLLFTLLHSSEHVLHFLSFCKSVEYYLRVDADFVAKPRVI